MSTDEKKQYDSFAGKYDSVEDLPCSKVEGQLVRTALGDCTGLTVLDLGGGSGLHARRALDAGAASVDVVDISIEMLRIGEGIEAQLGRSGRTRWLVADLSKPLAEQIASDLRPEGYGVVMANWVLDHATSVDDLKAMWANAVAHLKPGGKFLGVRVKGIYADYMKYGKYGVTFSDISEIPGGLGYKCNCLTQPPFSFDCTSMMSTMSLDHAIPRELGLVDFAVVPPEDTDVVKDDVEFWKDFVENPNLAVVVARKE